MRPEETMLQKERLSIGAGLKRVAPYAVALAAVMVLFAEGVHAQLAYVSNERDGTITIIDTATDSVVGSIDVGSRPRGLRLLPHRQGLYVALSRRPDDLLASFEEKLAIISLRSRRVLRLLDVGPEPVNFSFVVGDYAIVSNGNSDTASVVDVEGLRVITEVKVGAQPEAVATSPNGRWTYVTSEVANQVTVIDSQALHDTRTFDAGPRPKGIAFAPDGSTAYVTAEGGASVTIIDARRHEPIGSIQLREGSRPTGIVLSPDGSRAYVSNGLGGDVAVLDLDTGEPIRYIPAGERVWGIALTRDGRKLYAADSLGNELAVIDTETLEVVGRVATGDGPWGIVIAP